MSYPTRGSPGDDPSSYSLDGAKHLSRNCPHCQGEGIATIYNPKYTSSAVGYEFDRLGNRIPVCMRTTAFCLCPAGRKVLMLNQSNDSKPLMPDIHDVIAGKYHNWVADDPSYNPNDPIDVEALPESVRRLAKAMRIPKVYREPEPPTAHDQINRMFDGGDNS